MKAITELFFILHTIYPIDPHPTFKRHFTNKTANKSWKNLNISSEIPLKTFGDFFIPHSSLIAKIFLKDDWWKDSKQFVSLGSQSPFVLIS